jgi:hypothetical protein
MRRRLCRWWRGETGFILPIVLVLFAIGVLLIGPTLGHSYSSLRASSVTESKAGELHAADAGVEDALQWLLSPDESARYSEVGIRDTLLLNGTSVGVTIEEVAPYRKITSISTSPSGSSTTVEAYALVITEGGGGFLPSPFDYSVVTLNGDLVITGSSTISCEPPHVVGDPDTYQGNVWVNGNVDLGWSTNIWGDATITGTVNRPTNVKGDLATGAEPPTRPAWLDDQIDDYIASTLVDPPECSGTVHTGNLTMGWGTHGTYPAMQVTGNLTISGTSGDGTYTFTGPVCVGGNLNIQSGVNHVVFQETVKVGGYVYLQGNGTAVFEDVLYIDDYLKVGSSRSVKFMDKVAVLGNLKTSNRIVDIGGSKFSGADFDVVFMDTLRATEPNPNICYYVTFGSGRVYTFSDVVYTTEKLEIVGAAGCATEFTKAMIADCDLTVDNSGGVAAPSESSPLLVSRYGGIRVTGDATVDAVVYAPEGNVYVDGSSQLVGAIVSASATLAGDVVLKYPVLLRDRDDLHEGGGGGEGGTTVTLVSYRVL